MQHDHKREAEMRADDNLKLCQEIDGLRAERDKLRAAGNELASRANHVLLAPNEMLLVAAKGHLMNIAIPAWLEAAGKERSDDEA